MAKLRAATRGSKLALWQANEIARLLNVEVEIVIVKTEGDRTQAANVPIDAINARGVFVREVQNAVLDGRADFAVHSAKDMQSSPTLGLALACVPERGDPRDALIGNTIEGLPTGAVVATSSVRRRALMASMRPDLTFTTLRGNVDTRMSRVGEFGAIVLAMVSLKRLDIVDERAHALDPDMFIPQVSQGALGIECREDDAAVIDQLVSIEHGPSRRAVDAERAFLAELGGGCDLPVGAHATIENDGVHLRAMLASGDGRIVLRRSGVDVDGVALGKHLARQLLHDDGGAAVLSGPAAV